MAYDNTNTGALFKAKEQKTPNHPGYSGTINADGVEYWLAAWVKEDKNGNKYFSLSLKPKEEKKPEAKLSRKVDSDGFPDGPLPF